MSEGGIEFCTGVPSPYQPFPPWGLVSPPVNRLGPPHTVPSKAGAWGSCGGWGKRGPHSSPFLSSWEMSGSSTLAITPSSCHPTACPHLAPSILHTPLCPHPVFPEGKQGGLGEWDLSVNSLHFLYSLSPLCPPSLWSSPESKGMFWSLGRMGAPQRREEGEEATPLRPVSVCALNRTQQRGWGNENKQPLSAALPDGRRIFVLVPRPRAISLLFSPLPSLYSLSLMGEGRVTPSG